MQKYNESTSYEVGEDYIKVSFGEGKVYKYTYASAGKENVDAAKRLAASGEGLRGFILKNMKGSFVKGE